MEKSKMKIELLNDKDINEIIANLEYSIVIYEKKREKLNYLNDKICNFQITSNSLSNDLSSIKTNLITGLLDEIPNNCIKIFWFNNMLKNLYL